MDMSEILCIIERKRPGKYTDGDKLLVIEEIEQEIKNYCSIPKVPKALKFTVANMSIDLLDYEDEARKGGVSGSVDDIDISDIAGIKMGDTSIDIGTVKVTNRRRQILSSHESNLDDIIMNYRDQLNRFRRLW